MTRAAFGWATLAYLAAVLVLGGASAAGDLANLALQVGGALLFGWRLWLGPVALSRAMRRVIAAVAVLAVVQFVPLPPGIWTLMAGRQAVADGYALAHVPLPWLTLSLSPWHGAASLAQAIPALALFAAMVGAPAPARSRAIRVVIGVALISVLLGLVQWRTGQGYLYAVTNYGRGPGFFANSNHQSSFLLVALALGAGQMGRRLEWLMLLPLLLGLAINGSLACLSLLPVEVMALGLVLQPSWRRPVIVMALLPVACLVLAGALLWGDNDLIGAGAASGLSRHAFLLTGGHILRDFAPWGTGLGSFAEIYPWYEDPARVAGTFVNHVHDDWLELLIEGGVFALPVIAAGLAWLIVRGRAIDGRQRDRLIALVCIVVELVHSLVDYPLRTAALAGLLGMCAAWLDQEQEPTDIFVTKPARRHEGGGQPARHAGDVCGHTGRA